MELIALKRSVGATSRKGLLVSELLGNVKAEKLQGKYFV